MAEPTAVVEQGDTGAEETVETNELVAVDTLVEDVSIDGMCGVY